MTPEEYNYAVFEMEREQPVIEAFGPFPVRSGSRAPNFPLEDLDSGDAIEMKDLWRNGLAIIEFGSFT